MMLAVAFSDTPGAGRTPARLPDGRSGAVIPFPGRGPDREADERAPESGAGSEAELEQLYRQQWVPLLRLAWMLCGSHAEAEDVVQDVFIRYGRLQTRPDNPPAYLKRMVANRVQDGFRRQNLDKRSQERQPVAQFQAPVDESLLHVWQMVDRLEEPQRSAVIMRYYGDLSIEEIAATMNCSQGTVKSRLSRALARLKESGL